MKKIKVIFNPSSGRQSMERRVDRLCKLLLDDGYLISKFITQKKDDAMIETMKACKEDWDIIVASGGDGTVNEVAKGIANSERKIPVAILSSGTVNDFANYMKIPKNIMEFYDMIKRENTIDVDLGKVNSEYFVNVAAGGLLTNVGYQVLPETKMVLGRMAYYIEGLKEITLQNFEPIKLSVESEECSLDEEVLLFLISNSSSIGGFKKLAPKADVLDGLLDIVIVKKSGVQDLANIFINIFSGDHINHPNVVYFKSKSVRLDTREKVSIDIDGEYGGKLPATFEIVPKAFRIIV
ncbi:YegS/Rv2252/BmrU family lipid kinase [uncultured Tissierella sp.]|uniref:diacylglycerol/lipid kinase family protein n=1 Tax=uncultured Tissierella sp. TaxID=448160 RepID=UPI0028039C8F|nr:YegS/Rv2252/BmrU family lipid kinase [uncultured Tissierella sp.]MDU5080849.1 YegS/Rv2252/BmrU family lipid kinase [Bacillota bacterium]